MIDVHDLKDGYLAVRDHILERGRAVSPRGMKTWEVMNATIRIEDALDVLPLGIGRNPSQEIAAAEALQLIGGFSDPEMMTSISRKGFERFLDGGVFHGAYGPRVRIGVRAAFDSLVSDRDSRQAVVPVFEREDAIAASQGAPPRDLPCTKDLHFFVRDDKLELVASMRSNDFWKGLAYDAFQFTQLQASLAGAIGVGVGPYHHHADSLHIYESDLPAVEALHYYDERPELLLRPCGVSGIWPSDFQERAVGLWALAVEPRTPSEQWYVNTLRPHVRATRTAPITPKKLHTGAWTR